MHRYVMAALVIMAGLLSLGQAALAQDAAQPVYIVTYMEVAPNSASEARQLILAYANEARKASGAVQVDALQRISDPGISPSSSNGSRRVQSRLLLRPIPSPSFAPASTPCKAQPMTSALTQPFRSARQRRLPAIRS